MPIIVNENEHSDNIRINYPDGNNKDIFQQKIYLNNKNELIENNEPKTTSGDAALNSYLNNKPHFIPNREEFVEKLHVKYIINIDGLFF